MCLDVRITCTCGKHTVQMHLRDNVMTREVLVALFCPQCSRGVAMDGQTTLNDNDWVIQYDLDLARFLAAARLQLPPDAVDPAFLFDSGYATWQEMYPGEQHDILAERREIMALLAADSAGYLRQISSWNIARVEQLKADGWRKARNA